MEEKKDKEEPAKIYLAVRGKPKITDKKTFNLILPKKLAEAVDAHSAGVRNTVFSLLIAEGLASFELKSLRSNQPVTVDAEEFLKMLKYLPDSI